MRSATTYRQTTPIVKPPPSKILVFLSPLSVEKNEDNKTCHPAPQTRNLPLYSRLWGILLCSHYRHNQFLLASGANTKQNNWRNLKSTTDIVVGCWLLVDIMVIWRKEYYYYIMCTVSVTIPVTNSVTDWVTNSVTNSNSITEEL